MTTAPIQFDVAAAKVSATRNDGWLNVFTGMGIAGRDKAAATAFGSATRLDPATLEEMFTGDALAGRIVELPANDMTRAWIDFNHGGDPQQAAAVMKALQDLKVQPAVKEGIQWARLFGGSLVILAIDDGQPSHRPVNLDAIRRVDIVTVLDRWQCFPESYYQDDGSEKFGKVETYRLYPVSRTVQLGTLVHESRTLRFDGVLLPPRQRLKNFGWGDSVLNRVNDVLRDYQGSHGTLPAIIQEFVQTIYQLQGLAALLTQGGADATQKVINRLQTMQMGKSVFKALLLDEKEKAERTTISVAGLADLIDRIERRLVASTDGIPHNILLGEAAGHRGALNSGNGSAETRAWYDTIASRQTLELRPQLTYLIELLMRAKQGPTKGQVPPDWSFDFKSLWQADAKEEAGTRLLVAQADALWIDRDVISPGEAARSHFSGAGFSPDIVLDMAARNAQGELEDEDEPLDPEAAPAIAGTPEVEAPEEDA